MFVELTVAASRTVPLDRVAAMKADIERSVRAAVGEAEIAVTVNPRALDSETVIERVMVIARNRALAVHHVTVHAISGGLSVRSISRSTAGLRSPPRTTSRAD